jgi:aldehyde dehydrogenase (NAD+)
LRQPWVSSPFYTDFSLAELKKNFLTHKTKYFNWREGQLKQFLKGMNEMEREFADAVFADLGRANNATTYCEILLLKGSASHDLKHLKEYMTDINEETELLLAPARTMIKYEPLGVCGIYSAWNYPITTALKPVIQCITTGNAIILKPSEIAPATSKVLKKFVDRYLDQDFIRCIEGGIDVAVELNQQKLDLICFTGSTFVGKIVA